MKVKMTCRMNARKFSTVYDAKSEAGAKRKMLEQIGSRGVTDIKAKRVG